MEAAVEIVETLPIVSLQQFNLADVPAGGLVFRAQGKGFFVTDQRLINFEHAPQYSAKVEINLRIFRSRLTGM